MPARKPGRKLSDVVRPDATAVGKTQDQKNIERHGHGLDRNGAGYPRVYGERNKSSRTFDPDNSALANYLIDPTHNNRVKATSDSIKSAGRAMDKKAGVKKKN